MFDFKIIEKIKSLNEKILIGNGVITFIFWIVLSIIELIPTKAVSSDYSFNTKVSLLTVIQKGGWTWSFEGRIGWCGNEPIREWTYYANPYVTLLLFFSSIPIFLSLNLIANRLSKK